MPAFTFTMASGCDLQGSGFVDIRTLTGGAAGAAYSYELTGKLGSSFAGGVVAQELPLRLGSLDNDRYRLRVSYTNEDGSGSNSYRDFDVACTGGGAMEPNKLVLDTFSATDETAAGDDGAATIQASGGVAPLTALLVTLTQTQPATSGKPNTFTGLPGTQQYTLRVFDSSPNPQVVEATVTVADYTAPRNGCQDEYAANYDPLATSGGAASCTYAPRWRSAWQPMAVAVPAVANQEEAYISAELRIGFREGHPLNFLHPLGEPLGLRATVGPDGYATFRLGPYLQAALGVADGAGGYRLDLNQQTVDDCYIGYELRRDTGEMLEQGYALNSAVPEAQLFDGAVLSSFERVPSWRGYSWKRAQLSSAGRYGTMAEVSFDNVGAFLPCPSNPVPVAWLNPKGYFDFWVFQGRPTLGDAVGQGQQYREASSGQRRYSDPGDSYQTFKASSGTFGGDDLLRGLRTLWRSPQAWAILEPGGEWVPIVIPRGDREIGRLGVRRQELSLSFSTATPEWAQGQ